MRLATLFLLAAALFASALPAQTVQVVVKQGITEKVWSILLKPKVALSAFACAATEMEPGDTTACTITLTAPAKAPGVTVTVTLPTGFTGPASVLIGGGVATATFSITRLDLTASNPTIFPVSWSARLDTCTQQFAGVLLACCAREDRCGLPDSEIAWEPCEG
jgi:hypothetical protein